LTEQLERGNEYDKLRNVICIAILDFAMFKDEPAYRNAFHLRNDRSGRVFSDIVEINTIEIPKLPMKSDGTALWDFMKVLDAETEEEMENAARSAASNRR
jgi:predicted transposase/invertase (TIGR01784 family)